MVSDVIILGINAYHADAAACIVRDGQLLAAAEKEPFRRIKHWAGFPSQAISYCLEEANIGLSDVTHVAVNRSGRANLFRKLGYVAFMRPSPRLLLNRWRNRRQVAHIADDLRALPGPAYAGPIEYVEHHHAHLASAHPSTRTSRLSVGQKKRWTAFFARKWISWYWGIAWYDERLKLSAHGSRTHRKPLAANGH
jgi:predicted NodU family carbamoyl transferase